MKAVLVLMSAVFCTVHLGAQETPPVVADSDRVSPVKLYRNPHRARVLGTIFPGAGHIYAGEYLRGYVTYVGTIGNLGMGPVIYSLDNCTFAFLNPTGCERGSPWPYRLLGIAMISGGIFTWVSSARDAPHAAERANARHSARARRVTPVIEPGIGSASGLRAGLAVSW